MSAPVCRPTRSPRRPSCPGVAGHRPQRDDRAADPRQTAHRTGTTTRRPHRPPARVRRLPPPTRSCRPTRSARSSSRRAPDLGRPRRHHRHPRLRRRPRPPGAADDHRPASARSSTGSPRPTRCSTATAPGGPMLTSVTGPTFTVAGSTWTAPAGHVPVQPLQRGDHRGRRCRPATSTATATRPTCSACCTTRRPTTSGSTSNQNFDFTDDALMRPYKEQFDVGHFGTDNPATAVVEQMPFVVEFREDVDVDAGRPARRRRLRQHRHRRGRARLARRRHHRRQRHVRQRQLRRRRRPAPRSSRRGPAPGAAAAPAAALTDGMIDLVVNRGVDVVNMSIGGLPALNDGNNARAQLYNRLINDYGVQLFISAGNSGPGVNTIGDPSVAEQRRQRRRDHQQGDLAGQLRLGGRAKQTRCSTSPRAVRVRTAASSRTSPRPGSAISTVPTWLPGVAGRRGGLRAAAGLRDVQRHLDGLPAGRRRGGAAAVGRQGDRHGRSPRPQLRRALYTLGRLRSTASRRTAQGNGLFDVAGRLERCCTKGADARTYTVERAGLHADLRLPRDARTRAPASTTGARADEGGHKAGQSKTYRVKITRTSGPARAVTHTLSWVGNDGTFTSPRSVVLPLNKPVNVTVRRSRGAGAHGAILRIDDPATSVVDYEMMNTVVVADDADGAGLLDRRSPARSSATRPSRTSSTVPEGAEALQVNLSGIATGTQTRLIAINPYGVPVESTASLGLLHQLLRRGRRATRTSRAYAEPAAGRLGDRGRVAAHVAGARQPVHADRAGPGRRRSTPAVVELPSGARPGCPPR